jgi:CRISPR-associated protein Cmr5
MEERKMLVNRRLELSRSRAETAFKYVQEIKGNHTAIEKKYKSLVRKTPMRIKVNGLGATLAFVFSKKNKNEHHQQLYQHIKRWLNDIGMIDLGGEEFVAKVVAMEKAEYRVVTNELLAFLAWLRRFVDGMIEGEEDDE